MTARECLRFAPLLGARPGELSAADQAALQDHLAGCGACQARLADDVAAGGLLSEALLAEAAQVDLAPFVDQVMARVERPAGVRGFLRWVRRHKAVTALGALGLVLWLGGAPEPVPHAGEVEVSAEGRAPVVLTSEEGPVVLLGDPQTPEGS